jgi:hypothetical protein
MNILLVRGFGKCIECDNMTSYQMWVGKMQFYFCNKCIQELHYKTYGFLYKNNEYFKFKEMENKTKELIKNKY